MNFLVICIAVWCGVSRVDATERWLYASVNWTRTAEDPLAVTFHVEQGWYYNASWINGTTVRDESIRLDWGDGTNSGSTPLTLVFTTGTITGPGQGGPVSWFLATGTWYHTYGSGALREVSMMGGCCHSFPVDTTNTASWRLSNARVSALPIMTIAKTGGPVSFTLPVQYIGVPHTIYWETDTDVGLASPRPDGAGEWDGHSFEWDVTTVSILTPYPVQVRIERDDHSATQIRTVVDFVLVVFEPALDGPYMPSYPVVVSSIGVYDDASSAEGGETDVISFTVTSTTPLGYDQVGLAMNIPPDDAIITPCLEGLASGSLLYSQTLTCTRSVTWTVPGFARDYDVVFSAVSATGYETEMKMLRFKIIPPQPRILSPTTFPLQYTDIIYGPDIGHVTGVFFGDLGGNAFVDGVSVYGAIVDDDTNAEIGSAPAGCGLNHTLYMVSSYGRRGPAAYGAINYAPPTISSVAGPPPGSRNTEGGYLVTLSGINFGPLTLACTRTVTFDGVSQDLGVQTSYSTSQFSLGPSKGGDSIPIQMSVGGQETESPFLFAFDRPRVTYYNITDSPTAGGTNLTIIGLNFGTPDSEVKVFIDDQECMDGIHSHRWIYCIIPSGVGANVVFDITVENQGMSPTSTFSYNAPRISGLVFDDYPPDAGTRFTITGSDFGGVADGLIFNSGFTDSVSDTWDHSEITGFILESLGYGRNFLSISAGNQAASFEVFLENPESLVSEHERPPVPQIQIVASVSTSRSSTVSVVGDSFAFDGDNLNSLRLPAPSASLSSQPLAVALEGSVVTLTIANIMKGVLYATTSGAKSWILPSPASVVAGSRAGVQVGDVIYFTVIAAGTGSITLVPRNDVAAFWVSPMTISSRSATFCIRYTSLSNPHTYSVYRMA